MVPLDKNKTIAWSPTTFLAKNTGAPFAQLRGLGHDNGCNCGNGMGHLTMPNYDESTNTGMFGFGGDDSQYPPQMYGYQDSSYNGLGFTIDDINDVTSGFQSIQSSAGDAGSILNAVEIGANFVPVVGPIASSVMSIFSTALNLFKGWFGSGRREADVIVPVQNQLMDRIGVITDGIKPGQTPSVTQLQQWYVEVWQLALAFMEFVLKPQFTDRRASGQALNTVMPYIDGTCGYSVPLGRVAIVGQRNCINWNMLNSLSVAIQQAGGTVPQLGEITQAAAQGVQPSGVQVTGTGRGAYLATGVVTDFSSMIQQYGPYLLLGIGLMYLSRASKG